MGPLNVHQSKSCDHDRLGFLPGCPACRPDRLSGALSPEPVFARRVPVLLAAGVLALSAGASATSVAAEPDSQHEGLSAPEQVAPSEPGTAPTPPTAPPPSESTGPGGEQAEAPSSDELGEHSGGETALPFEVAPVPGDPQDGATGGADEVEPLEAEPAEDPDGRLPLADPKPPDPLEADDGAVPPTEPAPLTPPPPPPAPTTGMQDPGEAIEGEAEGEPTDQERTRNKGQRPSRDDGEPRKRDQTPRAVSEPAPAPTSADPPAPSVAAQPASDSTMEVGAPPAGVGRFHIVRPGESLWSIAAGLLGRSASPAAIAPEVHRLWELNKEGIGTGDPDLLPVGVKLQLR